MKKPAANKMERLDNDMFRELTPDEIQQISGGLEDTELTAELSGGGSTDWKVDITISF